VCTSKLLRGGWSQRLPAPHITAEGSGLFPSLGCWRARRPRPERQPATDGFAGCSGARVAPAPTCRRPYCGRDDNYLCQPTRARASRPSQRSSSALTRPWCSGARSWGSRARMARASCCAIDSRSPSRARLATANSGGPLWRVPRNSPGPADLQVLLRDDEAVAAVLHDAQPLRGLHRGARQVGHEEAVALRRATAHAASQLVELGQALKGVKRIIPTTRSPRIV
jgi:hypothetical protein